MTGHPPGNRRCLRPCLPDLPTAPTESRTPSPRRRSRSASPVLLCRRGLDLTSRPHVDRIVRTVEEPPADPQAQRGQWKAAEHPEEQQRDTGDEHVRVGHQGGADENRERRYAESDEQAGPASDHRAPPVVTVSASRRRTSLPPTTVPSTVSDRIWSGSTAVGSSDKMARSASLPTSRLPFTSSSPAR